MIFQTLPNMGHLGTCEHQTVFSALKITRHWKASMPLYGLLRPLVRKDGSKPLQQVLLRRFLKNEFGRCLPLCLAAIQYPTGNETEFMDKYWVALLPLNLYSDNAKQIQSYVAKAFQCRVSEHDKGRLRCLLKWRD